ncbi:MAG: hypothetical protein EHM58_18300 [Ignavibacteriae bacterium]|nr:MAG: hypothetical protein EHM58_18300 [Ignavibacteriota bacterium]
MKARNLFYLVVSLCFLLLSSNNLRAQDDMDFEEFMGMLSETFTDEQLDEMSFQVPWDVRVTSYAYGDFSDDGNTDIIIGIREKGITPDHSVDVYFLEAVNSTYKLVAKRNVKTVELNIEVAFMVKNGVGYVTNRDKHNWYFTSYEINDNQLVQLDRETFPIDGQNAGN